MTEKRYEGDIRVGSRYACDDGTVTEVLSGPSRSGFYTLKQHGHASGFRDGGIWSHFDAGKFRAKHTHEIVAAPAPQAANPPNPKTAHGAQKPALCLIPAVANLHEAMAMEEGARKYGAFNWRANAVEAMTYAHAARRHLDAWIDGQECSGDTSPPVHNLGHARACLAILLDAIEIGNLIDDRPLPGKAAEVQDRMKAAKVAAAAERDRAIAQCHGDGPGEFK